MEKIKIVTNGKLDVVGLKKIGKSLLLTLGAVVVGFVADSTGVIDYGSMSSIVNTFLPFAVNAAYKWLAKYESK